MKPQDAVLAPCALAMVGFSGIKTVDGYDATGDPISTPPLLPGSRVTTNLLYIRSNRVCQLSKIVVHMVVL